VDRTEQAGSRGNASDLWSGGIPGLNLGLGIVYRD
jgi:hypothetical protein